MGQDKLDNVRVSAGTASVLGLSRIASFDEPTCAYVMIGERCAHDCAFCAQARSSAAPGDKLSRVTWPEFSAHDLAQALSAAAGEGRVQRACAQIVGSPGAFERSIAALDLLRGAVGMRVPVSVSFSATARIEHVEALMDAGAERVALPIDACNEQLYRDIKGGHDMPRALGLIGECARRFPGREHPSHSRTGRNPRRGRLARSIHVPAGRHRGFVRLHPASRHPSSQEATA